MIESIHAQLSAWGRWVNSPIRRAVGYPSHSAGFGDYLPPGVEYKSRPPSGVFSGVDAIDETDKAVRSMRAEDRALCIQFYAIGPRWDAVCERLGMSKSVLYRELHRVHEAISFSLCDGM